MIRSLAPACASRDVPAAIADPSPLGAAAVSRAAADVLVQHGVHLVQSEAEDFQRDDAVEPRELDGLIEPVAAGRAGPGRAEQPRCVVIAQHAD
jgi:hypothetical protein